MAVVTVEAKTAPHTLRAPVMAAREAVDEVGISRVTVLAEDRLQHHDRVIDEKPHAQHESHHHEDVQ